MASDRVTPLENILIFSEASFIDNGTFKNFVTNDPKKSAFMIHMVKPQNKKVTQYLIVDFVLIIPEIMDIAFDDEEGAREYVLDLDPVDQDLLDEMHGKYLLYERQYETSL